MSYCVKCGVELGENECKCPLCGTPVYDPESGGYKQVKDPEILYKERATIRYRRNKYTNITGFCIFIVMLIIAVINLSINGSLNWAGIPLGVLSLLWFCMVFPVKYAGKLKAVVIADACVGAAVVFLVVLDALTAFDGWSLIVLYCAALACFSFTVCFISKLKVKHIISLIAALTAIFLLTLDLHTGFTAWSVYAAGGIALAWSFSLLPFYINRRYNVTGAIIFNSILVLAYLFFALSANGHTDKFLTFALPLVITFALPLIIIRLVYYKYRWSAYGILSLCFFFAALAALASDKIFNMNIYKHQVFFHEWAIITAACCVAVAVFLYIIEKNERLRSYIEKKLNV